VINARQAQPCRVDCFYKLKKITRSLHWTGWGWLSTPVLTIGTTVPNRAL